jgi:threonine 3-dehydrogenase
MADKMRAMVKAKAGPGLEMQRVNIPSIGPRDVLVKVRAASICGTDLHIWNWDTWSQSRLKPPVITGHEFGGEVVEVGEQVTTVVPGDFVSAECHIVCGTCYQCRTGQSHICQNVSIIGVDRDGCFAEYLAFPAENAWLNPPDMPVEWASIQDPFGNAVHTALSTDLTAKTVLVTGCGVIGLLAISISRAAGAAAIYATEVKPFRIEKARQAGATAVFNPQEVDVVWEIMEATQGQGVDVLLEMSGHPQAIKQGFALLKNGGYAALLGIPSQPIEFDLANDIVFKGATVQGISGRRMYQTWYQTRALLNSGTVQVDPLITHHFLFEEENFEKGIELMNAGQCGKVVLYLDEAEMEAAEKKRRERQAKLKADG